MLPFCTLRGLGYVSSIVLFLRKTEKMADRMTVCAVKSAFSTSGQTERSAANQSRGFCSELYRTPLFYLTACRCFQVTNRLWRHEKQSLRSKSKWQIVFIGGFLCISVSCEIDGIFTYSTCLKKGFYSVRIRDEGSSVTKDILICCNCYCYSWW